MLSHLVFYKLELHFTQAHFEGPGGFMPEMKWKCLRANIKSTIENDLCVFPKCLIGGHCLIGGCLGAGFYCICYISLKYSS